jgi:hypothetical protein
MQKVYFKAIDSYSKTQEIRDGAKELLQKLVEEEHIQLARTVPLKVHFGEKGNKTFTSTAGGELFYRNQWAVSGGTHHAHQTYPVGERAWVHAVANRDRRWRNWR